MVGDEPGHVVAGLGSWLAAVATSGRISGKAPRAPAYCRGVVSPDELVDRLLEAPLALAALADHASLLPLFTPPEAASVPADADERVARSIELIERQTFGELMAGAVEVGTIRVGPWISEGPDTAAAAYRLAGVLGPLARGGRPTVLRRPRPARGARGPGVVGLRARAPPPAGPAVRGLRRRLRRRRVHLGGIVDGHRPAHRGARSTGHGVGARPPAGQSLAPAGAGRRTDLRDRDACRLESVGPGIPPRRVDGRLATGAHQLVHRLPQHRPHPRRAPSGRGRRAAGHRRRAGRASPARLAGGGAATTTASTSPGPGS